MPFVYIISESILEIDSLEPDLILDEEEQYEDSIRPIPPPVWPSSQQPSKAFIGEKPLKPFFQNSNFQTVKF